jgi:hypothetical protein
MGDTKGSAGNSRFLTAEGMFRFISQQPISGIDNVRTANSDMPSAVKMANSFY